MRDAISDGTAAIVSITPGTFQGFGQPTVISGTVTGPVTSITVVGEGAINCSGNYGILIGYDASDAVLGQQPLSLRDPLDCSPEDNPDGVTFGAQATLTVSGGVIARFEITPMSPLEFPVFDLTGHASADYSIELGVGVPAAQLQVICEPAIPVRTTAVTCSAMMSDTSAFVPTHQKSTSGGVTIVDADIPAAAPVTIYQWKGSAAVATNVVISAGAMSAAGSFGIQTRIGRAAAWPDADFLDFPEAPPAAVYVSGTPLKADYPGITALSDGYKTVQGGVGHTFFKYPTGLNVVLLGGSGPNKGVRLVLSAIWEVEPGSEGAPAGVYVAKSLLSTDPFYQRQVGPPPKCTQANMQQLSTLILTHENRHWTEARSKLQPLHTQTVLEALIQLPGATPFDAAFTAAQKAYRETITLANKDVEENLVPVKSGSPECDMRP
ncbi:MAG: hypothetical protein H7Z40_05685 [Phycisphaerae bacterium]|nr:hypothetical protein [Gemmatimonadaceae bacterium]